VELLNDLEISTITDENGNYNMVFDWDRFSLIRLRTTKE
jgi:hypothetical protein